MVSRSSGVVLPDIPSYRSSIQGDTSASFPDSFFVSSVRVKLPTPPSSMMSVAEEIKKDWQQLGIETEIKLILSSEEEFEALLVTQQIPQDPDQYLLWHSTQTTNLSQYKSPKLDKLLEDGRKTFDQEERKEIYLDFQRFLVEDSPAIFLFHPTVYSLSRN